jgi:hypothetical protein
MRVNLDDLMNALQDALRLTSDDRRFLRGRLNEALRQDRNAVREEDAQEADYQACSDLTRCFHPRCTQARAIADRIRARKESE